MIDILKDPEPEPTPTEVLHLPGGHIIEDPVLTPTPTPDPAPEQDVDAVLNSILGRISSVADIKKNLKVMIYSDPGGRKSTFCGTAPDSLIIDVEKGLTSLKNHPELVDLSKVQSLEYKSFYQVEQLVDRLHQNVPQLEHVKTLCVDSMSEMHKRGLAEKTEREFAANPGSRNRYVAIVDDHSENNEQIRRLVSSLRDLDRNIILTAHAARVQQKDKSFKVYPDFSVKLANVLAGIMDIVAYMENKEIDGQIVSVMRVVSDGYIAAKNRIGLPTELIDPTWDTLWEYFEKHNAAQSK